MRLFLATAICLPFAFAVSLPAVAQQHRGAPQERPMPSPREQRPEEQRLQPPARMPSMEASLSSSSRGPDPRACQSLSGLEPGDRVLAIQPLEFAGRTQCRVKVMRSDGMVRVRVVDP